MLAEIGGGWYAKLEMGHDVKTSPATLLSITRALRLTRTETEYVFLLADVAMPLVHALPVDGVVPPAVEQLIDGLPAIGAVLYDRYITAVRWNAIADSMFGFAKFKEPIDRNTLVRVCREDFQPAYYGDDIDDLRRSLVGMFRRSYLAEEPTPFARQVYEIVSKYSLFRAHWAQNIVSEDFFHSSPVAFTRHHPVVGTFAIFAANLQVIGRSDFFMRVIGPANEDAVKKFEQLARLGKPSAQIR